jgi:hypothetical protein
LLFKGRPWATENEQKLAQHKNVKEIGFPEDVKDQKQKERKVEPE